VERVRVIVPWSSWLERGLTDEGFSWWVVCRVVMLSISTERRMCRRDEREEVAEDYGRRWC
jgi:hypothetical protein